ncbi:MAG: Phosphotransferase enzyme [Sclerophora amabilis]|nr:MAG: Phosphotransferase enzyme [Sclerophora amabilis]
MERRLLISLPSSSTLIRGRRVSFPLRWRNLPRHAFARKYTTSNVPGEASDDVVFRYDSRRWIYNERLRLAERYLKFDIKQLKSVAAASIGHIEADVVDFRKLAEGGFNRTFEITMRDGLQVIARLPYPSTSPKHYATASEVATMDFVRSYGIPVPKIYAYSATSRNPVGAEYIIMEKVGGKELGGSWFLMSSKERLKIISKIVEMESLLFSITLPASGSIYYKRDLDPRVENMNIPEMGEGGQFCIGPDAHYRWWYKERALLRIDRGPYRISKDLLRAVGNRELTWMTQCAEPRFPFEALYREIYNHQRVSPDDHTKALSDYVRISEYLAPRETRLNRPILRHPDLQPNNLFVSDSMDVLGVIDWQHCSALPLFLHAGPPKYFQNYGDVESEQLVEPRLPGNFAQLSAQKQDAERELYRRRQLHFFYVTTTAKLNEDHFDACSLDHVVLRQRLVQDAGAPWEGDNVTLKADLIRATQEWPELASAESGDDPKCPLTYSAAEIESCLKLDWKQKEANSCMNDARRRLGINIEGWVPAEGFQEAKALSEKLKAEAMEVAETGLEREEIQSHWPFDNHDENG